MIRTNLSHMQKGPSIARLDAIAYLWKELGTDCIHRPEAHKIVQIFRDVREAVDPTSLLITETNVPHDKNISYFGKKGEKEAHMVYNFALPPLVLHAFFAGDASYLTKWGKTLSPEEQTAFLNFLACHDGMGWLGAKGILPNDEIQKLSDDVASHGGKISYRNVAGQNGETKQEPYEACATWWSALNGEDEDPELGQRKMITSHAIMLALQGMPAIYYLSLFGEENDPEGWRKTQHNRDLLRKKLNFAELQGQLGNEGSKQHKIFYKLKDLIDRRKSFPAFSPDAAQTVLDVDSRVFAVRRGDSGEENVLAFHNVSREPVDFKYNGKDYHLAPYDYEWDTMSALQSGNGHAIYRNAA